MKILWGELRGLVAHGPASHEHETGGHMSCSMYMTPSKHDIVTAAASCIFSTAATGAPTQGRGDALAAALFARHKLQLQPAGAQVLQPVVEMRNNSMLQASERDTPADPEWHIAPLLAAALDLLCR